MIPFQAAGPFTAVDHDTYPFDAMRTVAGIRNEEVEKSVNFPM
jgi:hypothetical protein